MRPLMILTLLGLSLAVGLAQPTHPLSDPLPNCSGMANWGPDRYLVCHDYKEGEAGPRFGILHTQHQVRYAPVTTEWGPGPEGNDLESICPLAGQPDQFLASESSYFHGRYGRLFWIRLQDGPAPTAALVKTFALPTQIDQDIEGLATLKMPNGNWMVLLGGRGGKEGESGRLFWGVLDSKGELQWNKEGLAGEELHLPRRLGPFARTLSDMFVDGYDQLIVSACTAPGPGAPTRSLIFQAGSLKPDLKHPFHRAADGQLVWWVDGCKIEGLAPCSRPGFGPAYVTDDDELGGIWRASPASPSLGY